MEIEITSKESKPLLKRTEVRARLAFQGRTPARKEVVAAVAKGMKAKQELVIVRKIATGYGEQSAQVHAYVYDDKETLERLEHGYVKKKHEAKAAESAEKAEQPAEAKAEPAEKKEEKAAEKKENAPEQKAEKKDGGEE